MGRRGRLQHEGGQAFVEFVLVANILCMVVLGIFQFGHVYSQKIEVTDAARAAARKAATYGGSDTNDPTLRDAAEAAGLASAKVSSSAANMTLTWKLQNNAWIAGYDVKATACVPGKVEIFDIVAWSGAVCSSVTMRIEKRGVT
jgi:Flp pilus assembly protein TadG